MKRAWTVKNVMSKSFTGLPFKGRWKEVFGTPERGHNWIIWGQSGSGKTTFNFQLAKYLSQFETVLYNSLEEGLSKSVQMAYARAGITHEDRIQLVKEDINELNTRLLRRKSPRIVIIDSLVYTGMNFAYYKEFSERFPDTLKIWVAHVDGKEPRGSLAKIIRYDAHVKIYTEGFRAFVTSRFHEGGENYMDISKEKAITYFAE